MPLDNEDVQAIAQALQALLSAAPAVPAAATPPATISSVSIKLPHFWTTRPKVWFCQVEAQFATCTPAIRVDLTMFNHVVAALDHITAGEVEAIIMSPPADGKYDALKAALINAFGQTQASKDMELLSLLGLGDRKPSSFLRHMESLNTDPKTLLHALFLAQLSMEAHRILAGSSTTDLNDLAKEADAIMEVSSRAFSATSISGVHNPMSLTTVAMPKDLCFYHTKFGKEATGSATREGASWHTSFHPLLPPPLPRPWETGRLAAKNFCGWPRGEDNDSLELPLRSFLSC